MRIALAAIIPAMCLATVQAKDFTVKSPEGKVTLNVSAGDKLTWQVNLGEKQIIAPSDISLTLYDGTVWGTGVKKRRKARLQTSTHRSTPRSHRRAKVVDRYTLLTLRVQGIPVEFRVYDDAAAYRFVGQTKGNIKIKDEYAEYNFTGDHKVFVPYVHNLNRGDRYSYSYESLYDEQNISQMFADSLSTIPVIVDLGRQRKGHHSRRRLRRLPRHVREEKPGQSQLHLLQLCRRAAGRKPHARQTGHIQDAILQARRLHCRNIRLAHHAVARHSGYRQRRAACRLRHSTKAGRALPSGRHFVDKTRARGLGLDERAERYGRGLQVGHEHRHV